MTDPTASQALDTQVVYQDLALAGMRLVYMYMFPGKELTIEPLRYLGR